MTNEPPTSETPPSNPPDPAPTGDPVSTAPPARRLTRSRTDEWFGGVAGGLAEYFDTDPTLIRVGFVVAAFLTSGFAILAYIVAWIIIPEASSESGSGVAPEAGPRQRRGSTAAVVWGSILIIGGTLLLLAQLAGC